jgi:hypothetical protein
VCHVTGGWLARTASMVMSSAQLAPADLQRQLAHPVHQDRRRLVGWDRALWPDSDRRPSSRRPTRGLHMPLDARADFDSAHGFAQDVAALLGTRNPGPATADQRMDERGEFVYLDVLRNAYAS